MRLHARIFAIALLAVPGQLYAMTCYTADQDGFIVFRSLLHPPGFRTLSLEGLEIESVAGELIPIPGGDNAPAAPFSFLLDNDNNSVIFFGLGAPNVDVPPEGLTLPVGFSGGDLQDFDGQVGDWGRRDRGQRCL